jgi:selenocysteine-specific translation elongation factor
MDLPGAAEMLETLRHRFSRVEILPVAAAVGEGIPELKERLGELIKLHASGNASVES